ncbi:hypothetical protein JCM10207_002224 [Rhodosporidiobolus poonsookiae]
MRSLSGLLGLGSLAASVSAFGLDSIHAPHGNHLLVTRAAAKCKNGFLATPDGTSCYCPPEKLVNLDGSKCLTYCSTGSYNAGGGLCAACPAPFLRCSDPDTAVACMPGWFLSGTQCVEHCPDGTWEDAAPNKNRCRACADTDAATCSSSSAGAATACKTGFLYKGKCIDGELIPAGYYADVESRTAKACDEGTKTCSGSGAGNAITCGKDSTGKQYYLDADSTCVADCLRGSYGLKSVASCVPCDESELACNADGATECGKDSAKTQLYLYPPTKRCILPWTGEAGWYADDATNTFKACDDGVVSCIGTGNGNALECGKKADGTSLYWRSMGQQKRKRSDSTLIAGSCVEKDDCPAATWADDVTNSCIACDEDEASCTKNGPGSAITCRTGLYKTLDNNCVDFDGCKELGAYWPDDDTGACSTCDAGEAACTGNGDGKATACGTTTDGEQLYLYEGNCVHSTACPGKFYANTTTNACAACDPFVERCTGSGEATLCGLDTVQNKKLFLENGMCVTAGNCPNTTYADGATGNCESCTKIDPDAKYCTSPLVLSCSSLFWQDFHCVEANECRNGTYGKESNHYCSSCFDFGYDVTRCDKDGALECGCGYLRNRACVNSCGATAFPTGTTCTECTAAFPGSTECDSTKATKCDDSHHLQDGECVEECTAGFYEAENGDCAACAGDNGLFPHSTECTGEKATKCDTDFYLNDGTCQSGCDEDEYKSAGECTKCAASFGEHVELCEATGPTLCQFPYYVLTADDSTSSCVDKCPTTHFADGAVCTKCSSDLPNAATCSSQTVATTCTAPYVLYDNKCQDTACPAGYRQTDDNKCTLCSVESNAETCDATGALSCKTGYLLVETTKKCVPVADGCPLGGKNSKATFLVAETGHCQACEGTGTYSCSSANVATACYYPPAPSAVGDRTRAYYLKKTALSSTCLPYADCVASDARAWARFDKDSDPRTYVCDLCGTGSLSDDRLRCGGKAQI